MKLYASRCLFCPEKDRNLFYDLLAYLSRALSILKNFLIIKISASWRCYQLKSGADEITAKLAKYGNNQLHQTDYQLLQRLRGSHFLKLMLLSESNMSVFSGAVKQFSEYNKFTFCCIQYYQLNLLSCARPVDCTMYLYCIYGESLLNYSKVASPPKNISTEDISDMWKTRWYLFACAKLPEDNNTR